ncbi:DUF1016 N-terminal domain-containing protein [Edaphobacter sp.]|uniref:DUF1016 N-terminal domain-containing protein n=1 Tax=Edaphobacter sp. TaxID=1934404 RepID=UPI0039C8757E
MSKLISASRARALLSVNTVLIDLYWNIGEIISRKISAAEWGDGGLAELFCSEEERHVVSAAIRPSRYQPHLCR